jgi:hypothetical protein
MKENFEFIMNNEGYREFASSIPGECSGSTNLTRQKL